jgi:hypothetical protein
MMKMKMLMMPMMNDDENERQQDSHVMHDMHAIDGLLIGSLQVTDLYDEYVYQV